MMRKVVLALAAALLAAPLANAQPYPSKAVTILIGFTAGGTTDIIARLVAEKLTKAWGQSIIIDNKPGAGGNIGGELVAKAKPDGYTLLMGSVGPLAVNASLYRKMPFDNIRDLAPITLVADVPNVLVVNPRTVPSKSFAEFVTLAKATPGKYFYASTGSGTSSHLSGVLLNQLAGTDFTHVPYKGAVALNDVLSGEQVQCMFATIPSAIQHIRAGKLRVAVVPDVRRRLLIERRVNTWS